MKSPDYIVLIVVLLITKTIGNIVKRNRNKNECKFNVAVVPYKRLCLLPHIATTRNIKQIEQYWKLIHKIVFWMINESALHKVKYVKLKPWVLCFTWNVTLFLIFYCCYYNNHKKAIVECFSSNFSLSFRFAFHFYNFPYKFFLLFLLHGAEWKKWTNFASMTLRNEFFLGSLIFIVQAFLNLLIVWCV